MPMELARDVQPPAAPHRKSARALRVGSVSFLNAKPLIFGLETDPGVELSLEVPSKLLDGMRRGRYDVALLPVIDYQRMDGLRLLTSGGIGCDGPTLTVRIFSPVPIPEVRTLACDTDSHTSVALARVILAERYGVRPEFVPLTAHREGQAAAGVAKLLIGDKVVAQEPSRTLMAHQLDLGGAWKELTGLPFLFAAWMARGDAELGDLPRQLDEAKRRGLERVEEIIAREAPPRGWPLDVARRYLTHHLEFDVGPRHLEAVERFHGLSARHGLLDGAPRPLRVVRP